MAVSQQDNHALSLEARQFECASDAFKDKVILVTGASDGIGKTAAMGLAKHGATVVLLGRKQRKLEAVYDAIEDAGYPTPAQVPLDMEHASPGSYNELAAMLRDEFGRLDGLLNNASILGSITPLDQYDLDTWQQVMQINVNAGYYLTRAMLPLLQEAPKASVVFTTSGVGRKARAFWGAYAVSKFATEGMVQVFADELENLTNIRVNAINPGATHTKMRDDAYPAEDKNKLARPADILPAYYYLLSDASEGVSGQSLDAQT